MQFSENFNILGTEHGCNMDVSCKENRNSYLYLKPSHSLKKAEDKLYDISGRNAARRRCEIVYNVPAISVFSVPQI
jgi:hypothetical protein